MYTILKFETFWCDPCQKMTEDLSNYPLDLNKYSDKVVFKAVDVEVDETLTDTFGVTACPTIIIVKDRHIEVDRHVGYMSPEQLQEFIDKNIPQ